VGRTLGVLVAGGRGERLGLGVPKALAMVGGETLLARALRTLGAVADEVVVAAPAALELPVPAAQRVMDRAGAGVPLAGVVAGLGARAHARALVLGVDHPLVTPALLRALLERLAGAAVVMPVHEGVPQPLVAACDGSVAAALAGAFDAGEQSLRRALMALGPTLVAAEALPGGAAALLNVNTGADLVRAAVVLAREHVS
jgi:molybdenum cofactor guanylyltransferase